MSTWSQYTAIIRILFKYGAVPKSYEDEQNMHKEIAKILNL